MEIIIGILTLVIGIIIFNLYHKMFDISYFGFGAIFKEIFVIGFISVIIAMLIVGMFI